MTRAVADAGRESRIKVGVSEFAVTGGAETLTTSGLGSCVAVAVLDPAADVRGLLHAMLPAAASSTRRSTLTEPPPAKHVDTGVAALFDAFAERGGDRRRARAWLVGGAELIAVAGDPIGPRNVAAARAALARLSVPVIAEDVGGGDGRTVHFPTGSAVGVRAADGFERTL